MMRRANPVNIPIEVLRSISEIALSGSFSKAGEVLGLSQPAISAQVRKFQLLVGGDIFRRSKSGVDLNDRGKLVVPHIRRLLDINDQILRIGGGIPDSTPLRIGISDLYAEQFLKRLDPELFRNVALLCDHSLDLIRGVTEGFVDVACLLRPYEAHGQTVEAWSERFVWIKSPNFVVSPGAPIPLVGWPGLLSDKIAISLFEARGISYRLACSSSDRFSRIAAVRAGIGLFMLPHWCVPDGLVEARDYYLPPIPPVEAGIVLRDEVNPDSIRPFLDALRVVSRRSAEAEDAALPPRLAVGGSS